MKISQKRRLFVRSVLKDEYKDLTSITSETSELLFGDNLPQKIKDLNLRNKLKHKPSYSYSNKGGKPYSRPTYSRYASSNSQQNRSFLGRGRRSWNSSNNTNNNQQNNRKRTIDIKVCISNFVSRCKKYMKHSQGGQISNKIFQWRSLTSDRHILDIIKGDRIDFITIPPINHYAINAIEVADETLVQSELDKLLSKGIIKKTFHEPVEYVSPIFITYKSDGGIRLILNLKNLNKSVEFIHFKMHTIRDVLQLIRKNCFMISIDLKDAYHTIKIREDFQCFLKFNFKDQLYNYTCYPNGLGPCPRKFTKVTSVPMAEVRKIGHPISGYIDDFIMIKMTKIACFEAGISTANMFQTLGFVIHREKSQLEPTQKIIFLGFVIDSVTMTISLTEKRRNALHSLLLNILRLKSPTIQYVAKVIGHIISALPASKFGSLYYRDLENDKVVALQSNQGNFDAKMHISEAGIAEIKWWLSEINSLQNWILPPPITDELFCDASDYAWEGIYKLQKTGGAWLHS